MLLFLMARRSGEILTRTILAEQVWNPRSLAT